MYEHTQYFQSLRTTLLQVELQNGFFNGHQPIQILWDPLHFYLTIGLFSYDYLNLKIHGTLENCMKIACRHTVSEIIGIIITT